MHIPSNILNDETFSTTHFSFTSSYVPFSIQSGPGLFTLYGCNFTVDYFFGASAYGPDTESTDVNVTYEEPVSVHSSMMTFKIYGASDAVVKKVGFGTVNVIFLSAK